ncbi:MAG: DinB family protein [Anaerolineae bacterium]|nr:DinB family protein [Anaerolineae bacterium]
MSKISQTQTARQVRCLQRLTEARDRLLDAIAGLDETTLTTENVVDGWTVKDMCGHIVSWNDEFRADIQAILQGQDPGYEHQISGADDFSQWNEQQTMGKRNWSWQHIRADLDRDYQEASNLVRRLRPSDFRKRGVTPWKGAAVDRPAEPGIAETDSVETLVNYHWRHINQHVRMIERWRRQREGRQGGV